MPFCAVPGISLTDYSKTPLNKGWGAPCAGQYARVLLTEAAVTVSTVVAELVGLIMRANERNEYLYRKLDTGAYNCRKISGSTQWSNHAWGLAVDCNWQTNPYQSALRTDMPTWHVERFNRYGFAWGGHYTGRRDAMHYEFMGTPAQSLAALRMARVELADIPPVAPTPPADTGKWHEIGLGGVSELWTTGEQVRNDQADLNDTGFNLPVDGFWGLTSVDRAKEFQGAAGIGQDGAFGQASRIAIHKVPSWRAGDGGGYTPLRWQQELKEHGWRIDTDGAWGSHSVSILRQFQTEKHVPVTGARDAATWTALACQPQ